MHPATATTSTISPIQAKAAELQSLWALHDAIDAPYPPCETNELWMQRDEILERLEKVERAILVAPIETNGDVVIKNAIIYSRVSLLAEASNADDFAVLSLAISDVIAFSSRENRTDVSIVSTYWTPKIHDYRVKEFYSPKPTRISWREQYENFKSSTPEGHLTAALMGDFYEWFGDQAEIVSSLLGIVLTKRGKHLGQDISMCGVPVCRFEFAKSKLEAAGHRVAVFTPNQLHAH